MVSLQPLARGKRALRRCGALAALALAGCSSQGTVARQLPADGPAHTLRVALAEVRWPLPAHPRTRDEMQLEQTLRSFRVVRARRGRIVVRRHGLQIVFRQVEPHRAAVLFRRGVLDEAPVPVGDIRAALADGAVASAVRVTRLQAVDALVAPSLPASLLKVLSQTADRRSYALLVPEDLRFAQTSPPARVFRAARRSIAGLPHVQVRVAVEGDATLRYGASLLVASWRDLGLDVRIARRNPNAVFTRRTAPGGIRLAHAVDTRFVSPRIRGWREDRRGIVDYRRVRLAREG
jgi:hypothetical protein